MRHVDDGTIHAWLDEQISDPVEAAWIEEHVRECGDCRARLASERATFDRAQTLLAGAAPSVERPPFEPLVARAGRSLDQSQPAVARRGTRERVWMQAGWAASLALAVGLGWTARELTESDTVAPQPAPVTAEARPTAQSPEPSGGRAIEQRAPERAVGAAVGAATTPPVAQPRASQTPVEVTPPARENQREAAAAAPDPQQGLAASAADTVAETVTPPPVAPAAAAPALPRQEVVSVTGQTVVSNIASAGGEWRSVARTVAAARTGMPLYGIEGLEPLQTELSPDGAAVRTTYRLASGDVVALMQQRAVAAIPANFAEVQSSRRAAGSGAARGGIVGQQPRADGLTWSDVRGGVRVTLQRTSGAADLDAIAARLRVE